MFLADYTPARQLGNDTPLTRSFAVVLHAVRFREERQRTFVHYCMVRSDFIYQSPLYNSSVKPVPSHLHRQDPETERPCGSLVDMPGGAKLADWGLDQYLPITGPAGSAISQGVDSAFTNNCT